MGNIHKLERKEIFINDNACLILEKKSDDYEWVEVTYKTKDKEIFIGSYYTISFSEKEWLEYNSNYIVIMKNQYGYLDENIDYYDDDNYGYIGPSVQVIFNIEEEAFVEGTDEEKLELYNSEFKFPNKVLKKQKEKTN